MSASRAGALELPLVNGGSGSHFQGATRLCATSQAQAHTQAPQLGRRSVPRAIMADEEVSQEVLDGVDGEGEPVDEVRALRCERQLLIQENKLSVALCVLPGRSSQPLA